MDNDKHSIPGIRIGVTGAGIRYKDRDDLVIFELAEGTTTAATFTRNRFAAAPVIAAKQHLQQATPRYLLINAGNANAGTGERGMADALASCEYLARQAGCTTEAVLPFSTGVIGEYLPMDRLSTGIDQALAALDKRHWAEAAAAIMTTDTREKLVTVEFTLDGYPCRITGIAKGSGMIRPDMATMLAFIATDARVPAEILQAALEAAVEDSFNCITVDGDTSTNDACVVCATGQGELVFGDDELEFEVLKAKLGLACEMLAEAIVRDGEGATKFVRIRVQGGRDKQECREIGFTVAHSPLVKTALYGQDPNWGRILAAVGRAPVADFDLNAIEIFLDDVCIVKNGGRDPDYVEEEGDRVMHKKDITITIDMHIGEASAEILTSDLSHDYVSINADYRS